MKHNNEIIKIPEHRQELGIKDIVKARWMEDSEDE